jgi:hypothetical protein
VLEPGPIADTGFSEAAGCANGFAFKIPGQPQSPHIAKIAVDKLLSSRPNGVIHPGFMDNMTVNAADFLCDEIKGALTRLYMENE